MKTVYDMLPYDNGIYANFRSMYPTDYEYLFGDTSAQDLDIQVLAKMGGKPLSPICRLTGEDVTDITRMIHDRFYESWKKIFDALGITYNVLTPVTSGYTITKVATEERESSDTREDLSKVYGIDTTTGQPDNSSHVENSGNSTVDNTSTTTYTKMGVGNLTPNRLIEAEINFRRTSFINITLSDIQSFITLPIY